MDKTKGHDPLGFSLFGKKGANFDGLSWFSRRGVIESSTAKFDDP
ncbi:hypothetical protein VB712_09075 [Spirulina sp. CCNP1310]|nr:hypothetical protein [Spirulina sp. CCNP1310]